MSIAGEKLEKLVELAAVLRSPEGCAWDRKQDYDSGKKLLLEEAYEVVDAVEARNFDDLREELGDLLFQVVFYSQMAREEGRFELADVIEEIHSKLVRRHPHVFGDVRADTPAEALNSWQSAKAKEKRAGKKGNGRYSASSVLEGISSSLPAALEAHKLGARAAEVGFDWRGVEDILEKISEELEEVRRVAVPKDRNPLRGKTLSKQSDAARNKISPEISPARRRAQEEVGDLLFAAANLARFLGFDAETALRAANRKFKRRFESMEAEVLAQGKRLRDFSLEELDGLWEKVKAAESK
ncbi:MAG: nucleoside triphosphate pyrophosphohydrolase [Acidobacteria bacterium]|nr:nucleoside triphosphate pyrophosphohydrolase [Acidobacteriota bacterium]